MSAEFFTVAVVILSSLVYFFYLVWKTFSKQVLAVIEIPPGFGVSGLLTSFFWLSVVYCALLLLASGLLSGKIELLRMVEPFFVNMFKEALFISGFQVPAGADWMQLRFFLAAAAAAIFAFPMAFSTGLMGPRNMDRILLGQKTIEFPGRFAFNLSFHLVQKWTDLVTFETKTDQSGKKQIKFCFKSGEVCLKREHFSESSFRTLLCFVTRYAPQSLGLAVDDDLKETHRWAEEFEVDLFDHDKSTPESQENLSYTEIWDSDYKRHTTSTIFVPLAPGDKLQGERYEILERIGNTAMSATYLAKTVDGQTVVVKETAVPVISEAAKRAKDNYLRECQNLSKLSHDRIANVLDAFVENSRCYLILDFIPGKDLNRLVAERGAFSEKEVREIALSLVDTLIYLHTLCPPLIHRDLTPHNIVLTKMRDVFVVDFGAANAFQSEVTGTMIGKQSYIAPEQLRGKSTPQSDLYAFGATLYKLLIGKDPDALSECNVRSINPAISEDFSQLIRDCTKFEASERIGSAQEVKRRLLEIEDARQSAFTLKLESAVQSESETLKIPRAKLAVDKDG